MAFFSTTKQKGRESILFFSRNWPLQTKKQKTVLKEKNTQKHEKAGHLST